MTATGVPSRVAGANGPTLLNGSIGESIMHRDPQDTRMSNGRANESNERDDDGDRSTVDDPGGGPRRVVSETSVDDILESLDDGPANGPGDGPADVSTDGSGAVGGSPGSTATRTTDDTTDATEPDAADESGSATETSAPTPPTEEPDEAGDGTELTYQDDDALAGRVATNDVTGADVRAAETGSDRETTPEIDDVDLSLDDLENAQIGGSPSPESDGNASDDGARDGDSEDDGQSDDGDTGGVATLFRRLFPWTR